MGYVAAKCSCAQSHFGLCLLRLWQSRSPALTTTRSPRNAGRMKCAPGERETHNACTQAQCGDDSVSEPTRIPKWGPAPMWGHYYPNQIQTGFQGELIAGAQSANQFQDV